MKALCVLYSLRDNTYSMLVSVIDMRYFNRYSYRGACTGLSVL